MNRNFNRLIAGLICIPLLLGQGFLYAKRHETGIPIRSIVADLQVSIGSAPVAKGAEVCVPVRVNNFTGILGMEFSITYDPAVLTYKSVKNFNLSGLSETSSFGLPGVGINPLGTLKVSWLDPAVSGITVANGVAIFEVCFTAGNTDATTTVGFGTSSEILNAAEEIVPLAGTAGTLTVGTGGGGTGGGGTGGGGTGGGGTGGGTGGGGTGTTDTVGTGTFTLAIRDTTVAVNRPICLKVKSGSFRDILGIELTMNYSAAALRFDSVAKFNLAGLNEAVFGLPGVGINPAGAIKLSWLDPNVAGVRVVDSTALFELCFTTLQDNITTSVTFAANPEIINKDEATVGFVGNNGIVVVGNGSGTGTVGTGPFTLDVPDATVQGGADVCVPVIATNFSNILGMEFSLTYDPTKLQFKQVTGMNLEGLSADGSFGLPGTGSISAGTIKVSWNDPDVIGKSKIDGTTLFQVCFTAIGSNTTAVVGFGSTSEIIKGDDSIVSLTASPGTVTINGMGTGSTNLTLLVGNGSVQPGQEVCLDLRATNFSTILGMEFTMRYDTTKLRFNQVTGFGALRGLDGTVFGLPGVGTNPKGAIKVAWVDPEVSGVTLTDNASLFRVCFTAVGASGTSTMVTIGTPIEITNANDQAVTPTLVPGEVSIGGSTGNNGRLQLVLEDKMAMPSTEVCLNMDVQNFTSVVGMEYTLKYSADSLTFVSIKNLNLAGLEQASFNTTILGSIKLAWYDPLVAGVTLPGTVSIFQVCFNTKTKLGVTRVQVDATQNIEITDGNDQDIPRDFNAGVITISNVAQPPVIGSPAVITPVACFGAATGGINISVTGGSGNYTYRWSYQNAATQDLTNVPAGSYSVTVTDASTLVTATQSFTVSGPVSAVQISSVTPTPVTCFGALDGTLTAVAIGGTGTLRYAWSNGLPAIANPINVVPGSYTVTVTDANGCQAVSNQVAVTQPDSALAVLLTAQNATCIGIDNGRLEASASGGTKPYTYTWSNNLPINQTTQTGLAVGTYRVTVTDARGCTASMSGQIGQSAGVSITMVQPTPIDLGNDGAIDVTVSGGKLPYVFSWTGPSGFSRTSEDLQNLNTTGTYCFNVRDSLGCIDTACVLILQRLKFGEVSVQEACSEVANGGISVVVTGGQTPYQYLWSNGSTLASLSGVRGGLYKLTVTDAVGNSRSGDFEVPELAAIMISGSVSPSRGSVGAANGAISLSVLGGEGTYSYIWNNGSTASALTGLGKGTYCVTVTDAYSCSNTRCFQVDLVALPLTLSAEVTNNRCFGQEQGKVRIQVNGGLEPYFALFNDGMRIDANSMGVIERSNLKAGTYTYVVTDKEGTTVPGSSIVSQAAALTLAQTVVKHDNDQPGCTGTISIALTGGTGSYNVRWNSNNAGSLITNLCEGSYVPTVEDANGCSVTFAPIAINTFSFLGQIIDNACPGDLGGDVNLSVEGGAVPYTYFWLNAKGDTISRTKDLSNVLSGTYRVIVKESSGNSLLKEYTIGTRSNLSARALVTSNFRTYGVSCHDKSDGVIEATALNGIGTNYIYSWLFNDQLVGAQQRLTGAKAGTYTLQVTDEAGCMTETEALVSAPPLLGISGSVNHISCVGARDGDILVSASGGVPGSIYTYRWNTGATGPRISFLTKGNYMASVTDANNCTVEALFAVLEPQPLSVTIETTPATVGTPDCNGAARATVTGGTRPYAYISNVPNAKATDSVFLKLCPGEYALEIVDSRGCKTTPNRLTFTILDRTLPCLDTRTVITPDGDGANETFEIRCIEDLTDNRLLIFNEWGQMVFEGENYSNNWSGRTTGGAELPEGAYFYVLEYTDIDGNRVQVKGSISLLRQ